MPEKKEEGVPIVVQLALMGNGVEKHCVKMGSTVAELFEQAEFKMGETVRMNGVPVKADTKITKDGSLVTSTSAVKGGN